MQTIITLDGMQRTALEWKRGGKRIGFVPTMGFLHEGHLSLMRRARELADVVVVSLFVNPRQFGPGEDFERYPRDAERDAALCRGEGVDVLFCPRTEDMYPRGSSVHVEETHLSRALCGRFRPGHFQGVVTVVTKLFHLVMPDVAVFGQKDAQQARILLQVARDLNFPTELVVAPTVREPDGLAMSSRNTYLSGEERRRAAGLYGALEAAKDLYRGGERSGAKIVEVVRREMLGRMGPVEIDYAEVVNWETLHPVERMEGRVLLAAAVRMGSVRLIDNVLLGEE